MKKILTSAGLIAVGVSSLQAAPSGPSLSSIEATKPWSISAALRGFYDDNYLTVPNGDKRDSFGYEVKPSVSLNLPLENTFIGLSYEYSLQYYEDRAKYDQSHKFDGRLDHSFSERYRVELNESFVMSREPEVLAPSGGGAVSFPLRTEGDNIRNQGGATFYAQMTELLGLEIGYGNTFYDYKQDGAFIDASGNVVASRSGLLDRDEHLASLNLRWKAMPETEAIFGYQFGLVNFSSREAIGTSTNGIGDPEPVHSDIRDARSHYLYVGADHRFNPQLNGSIRLGGQYNDYYHEGRHSLNPYADASLTYLYQPGSSIQAGVSHTRTRTDIATVESGSDVTSDQEVTSAYASINHAITPSLLGSLLLRGQRGTFFGGTADGDVEWLFLSGVNFAYTINPHLLAEAGYNFDYLRSQQPGRDYHRNRVYIGIRATY
jgi:hypothetical protein